MPPMMFPPRGPGYPQMFPGVPPGYPVPGMPVPGMPPIVPAAVPSGPDVSFPHAFESYGNLDFVFNLPFHKYFTFSYRELQYQEKLLSGKSILHRTGVSTITILRLRKRHGISRRLLKVGSFRCYEDEEMSFVHTNLCD